METSLHILTAYLDARDGNGSKEEGSDASNHTCGSVGKEGSNLQNRLNAVRYHSLSGLINQRVNALKQMETVITKQTAKQEQRDKSQSEFTSQFTSQLMPLDNSGAEIQQHHILQHNMALMGVTNFCSLKECGELLGGCKGAKHKACALLLPFQGLQRGTARWQWPPPPYARHTG